MSVTRMAMWLSPTPLNVDSAPDAAEVVKARAARPSTKSRRLTLPASYCLSIFEMISFMNVPPESDLTQAGSCRPQAGSCRRREFLKLMISGGAASITGTAQNTVRRPNFILIVTDDQGIGDVGCYGHPEVRTPNLDRLAASGVRFSQWYANAPVCSASRAAILTGKYPDRTGVRGALTSEPTWDVPGLRQGETTLPLLLRNLGYNTAAFGKWHLGSAAQSRPLAQGFDEFFGWYSGWLDAFSHRYYQLGSNPGKIFHDLWRNETEVFEEPNYMTELLGREARAFLARQTKQKPFFQYVAFGAPHYSMMAPKKYLDRFPTTMERDRRMHLAMVAAVDDQIGSLLDQLQS